MSEHKRMWQDLGNTPEGALRRAVYYFRTGRAGMASVSLQAYLRGKDRVPSPYDEMLVAAVHRADYLAVADIIEVGLLQCLAS